MKTEIYVATHKQYQMPNDSIYMPIHVGKKNSQKDFGYLGDDTNYNISEKNSKYCELTALYWLWKNSDADIVGLVHYRRLFVNKKGNILSESEINSFLNKADIIVAKKRNYYIETVESHYSNAHFKKDLILLREVLESEDRVYFDNLMKQRELHLYNMVICKKDILNEYCEWLFPILEKLEFKIDTKNYDSYQKRVIGFLAERLFNVWLMKKSETINIIEKKVINLEKENKIKKGFNLVLRKYKTTKVK
ncbi:MULTISPECIES: DUF4422 domain-containing protein [unclassified Exiguobacterium]|uniref:DUF4422 domain-containing protein n=1 Tax=unclassified Exiguobacterium TaxID=2644629 RepID=UPI001BE600C1|nr:MULTISPECIES: DUF4422 domain-containing protein [unclassified Exiguobacterium]